MLTTNFPEVLDSTTLAAFKSCERKAYYSYFEDWKPKQESVHLVAGGAFARGLEVTRRSFYVDGKPADEAIGEGIKALLEFYGDYVDPDGGAKSPARMAGALEYYFSVWPLGEDTAVPSTFADGSRGIEFSFVTPLPIAHPVTGNPILYSGRCDMFVDFAGGRYLEDDKTTSQLGASWPRQWVHRSQFTSYCWAAREAGQPVAGVLVRGVSILKTKYDSAENITNRADWEIDRWIGVTCTQIERMIGAWKTQYWNPNLDNACAEYGGCSFLDVCKSPSPETWLPVAFERRHWDPIKRTESLVEDGQ